MSKEQEPKRLKIYPATNSGQRTEKFRKVKLKEIKKEHENSREKCPECGAMLKNGVYCPNLFGESSEYTTSYPQKKKEAE